jgi:predicted GH43/DUF377 family glycosyl hydrolase
MFATLRRSVLSIVLYLAILNTFALPIKHPLFVAILFLFQQNCFGQITNTEISSWLMDSIYQEVKTPYKYGLVKVHSDTSYMVDSPTLFKRDSTWFMTFIVYDGKGYETWLAQSNDLLHWDDLGKILPFRSKRKWDASQAAGYPSLIDIEWDGNYNISPYQEKYWMSYLGSNAEGYEEGQLAIGMSCTSKDPHIAHHWKREKDPVMKATDSASGYWEADKLFKSTVIEDKEKTSGYPFVMFYNASGDTSKPKKWVERLGMAFSNDMVHWERHLQNPVIDHGMGISGDAYIQKIGDLYVMFYFGAFWPEDRKEAFNRFACSFDLLHWTDWEGEDLIKSSEPFDQKFAHKLAVVKWKGVVYHFYCAVNEKEQRGIAVATSKDLGKSTLHFTPITIPLKR